jgi:hypothetical protein
MRLRFVNFACLLVLAFAGCADDIIDPDKDKKDLPKGGERVAVLCEGNFMWANARLDLIQTDTGMSQLVSNVYEKANNKPIGDVLQSGLVAGNNLFLSINNSGKVLGLDPYTFKQKKMNAKLKSPRCLMMVGGDLWVSDLYANRISVLDTQDLHLKREIVVPGWTEQMVRWGDEVAVACYSGKVLVYDYLSGVYKRSMDVDSGALYLAVDGKNQLWVVSSVGSKGGVAAFGASASAPLARWTTNAPLGNIYPSADGNSMYVSSQNKIFTFPITATSDADLTTLFNPAIKQLYGYFFNPLNQVFYLADAKDFVSNGDVIRYPLQQPSQKTTLATGVNPSGFVLLP